MTLDVAIKMTQGLQTYESLLNKRRLCMKQFRKMLTFLNFFNGVAAKAFLFLQLLVKLVTFYS